MEEHHEEQYSTIAPEEMETWPDQDEEPEAQDDAVTMGDLLDEEASLFSRPKRGQIVDGVIVQIDPGAILVDIGAKLDGFIHPNETEQLQRDPETCPKIGDHVLVYVIQPANKDGHAVLSLNRAQAERDWRTAQQQYEAKEILDLSVMGYNKGGLIVRLGEVRGFIPASQLDRRIASNNRSEERMKQLSKLVGQNLKLKIIELDRSSNRLILSERLAMREWRDQTRETLLDDLREGEIRSGRVSGLCDFGAFVDIGGADGLVHLSELSWDQVPHPRDVLRVGDEVDVYVLNVDRERKRIALSIKRTKPEPWSNIHNRYQVGQIVTGQVTKLASFGAFVRLEEGIEGLAHISELAMRRIQHPKEVVQEGETLEFRIIRIDSARRRMRLSLKQLEEEAVSETKGWAEEDVPTPEVLTKERKRQRRAAVPAAPDKTQGEEDDLAEWQERLREYQRTLPASPAGKREPLPQAEAGPAEETSDEPPLAVMEVEDEPKALVEMPEKPKAVVKVPDEEPPVEPPDAEAEDEAPAPAEAKVDVEDEAPAPAEVKADVEDEAPAPAEAKADVEDETPAPAEAKADVEDEAPAPAEAKADVEDEAPAPAEAKADAEDEAPAPAEAKAKADAEDETPAPAAEASEVAEGDEDSEAAESDTDTPD